MSSNTPASNKCGKGKTHLEPNRHGPNAVKVATQPDMIPPRQLRDILNVIGDFAQTRPAVTDKLRCEGDGHQRVFTTDRGVRKVRTGYLLEDRVWHVSADRVDGAGV